MIAYYIVNDVTSEYLSSYQFGRVDESINWVNSIKDAKAFSSLLSAENVLKSIIEKLRVLPEYLAIREVETNKRFTIVNAAKLTLQTDATWGGQSPKIFNDRSKAAELLQVFYSAFNTYNFTLVEQHSDYV